MTINSRILFCCVIDTLTALHLCIFWRAIFVTVFEFVSYFHLLHLMLTIIGS